MGCFPQLGEQVPVLGAGTCCLAPRLGPAPMSCASPAPGERVVLPARDKCDMTSHCGSKGISAWSWEPVWFLSSELPLCHLCPFLREDRSSCAPWDGRPLLLGGLVTSPAAYHTASV